MAYIELAKAFMIFALSSISVGIQISQQETMEMATPSKAFYTNINMTSLTLTRDASTNALVKMISSPSSYMVLAVQSETGCFVIENGRVNILEVQQGLFTVGASTSVFKNINFSGDLIYQEIVQWKMYYQQYFWKEPYGWTDNSITTCGGINMLGGYGKFAQGEVKQTFGQLPAHTSVRVVANFHFIDSWSGQTGFMRINVGRDQGMEYVWNQKYDSSKSINGINICGSQYPQGKFTVNIDIIIPHEDEAVTIGFGSTLETDPFESSFGVSNLQIYIK